MNPYTHNIKAVDVLTDKGWVTFDSVKAAAAYIGVADGTLSRKLIKDMPCAGHKVRYHHDND